MERSVEVFAIILFGVLGLSHILQPKAWAEFFILLRGKGEAGVFTCMPGRHRVRPGRTIAMRHIA